MISLSKEPISVESERRLRRWLAQPEADTLRKVVAAQTQFLQADGLAKALTAHKGDSDELLMIDDFRQAARWNDFNVLLELIQSKPPGEPFQVARLHNPTPHHAHSTEPDENT